MTRAKWNRRPKRSLDKDMDNELPSKQTPDEGYKVSRVRPRRRKRKHPGYTVMPAHRLWIFENNKT